MNTIKISEIIAIFFIAFCMGLLIASAFLNNKRINDLENDVFLLKRKNTMNFNLNDLSHIFNLTQRINELTIKIERKNIHVNNNLTKANKNINSLNKKFENVNKNLTKINENINSLNKKFENIKTFEINSETLSNIEKKVSNLNENMNSQSTDIKILKMIVSLLTNTTFINFSENISKFYKEMKEKKFKIDNIVNGSDSIIYQSPYDALSNKIIEKYPSGATISGWDETSYKTNLWNKRPLLSIGSGSNLKTQGIKVNIPDKYDQMWLRICNDRYTIFRVLSLNGTELGIYAGGFNRLNELAPDGGASDTTWHLHKWIPISVKSYSSVIVSAHENTESWGWISGVAFSKNNLWNFAWNTAYAFYLNLNGGTRTTWYGIHQNDQLTYIPIGEYRDIRIPIVYSGKDKLIFLIGYNPAWNEFAHYKLEFLNSTHTIEIERFKKTYSQNPFETFFNSNIYSRYFAAFLPKELIQPNDRFVTIRIHNEFNVYGYRFYFRLAGSHDYE